MDLTTPTDMTRLKNAFTFSVGGDRVLKMWDLSKRCIIAVKGFEAVTESALVSVDYQAEIKQVVVAAQDGTIILLSVEEVAFADQKGKNKEGDQDEEEEALEDKALEEEMVTEDPAATGVESDESGADEASAPEPTMTEEEAAEAEEDAEASAKIDDALETEELKAEVEEELDDALKKTEEEDADHVAITGTRF